jgi:hypothetical protein
MILFMLNKKEWVFKKKTAEEIVASAAAVALVESNRSTSSETMNPLQPLTTTLLPKHSL